MTILPDGSRAAVRQDSALLAWLALRTEGKPRRDEVEVVRFVDDQGADKSTGCLLGAVDEVFEAWSMSAVGSQQLASA